MEIYAKSPMIELEEEDLWDQYEIVEMRIIFKESFKERDTVR